MGETEGQLVTAKALHTKNKTLCVKWQMQVVFDT